MRHFILASMLAFATPAFAWDITQTGNAAPSSVADQGSASQAQSQRATGGAGGNARATGGHATGGSVTNTIATDGGSNGRGPVSSAIPATIINGGCNRGGGSAVLQLPGVGLGGTLGGSPDLACQGVEIGRQDVVFAMFCLERPGWRAAAALTDHPCPQDRAAAVPQQATAQMPPDRCYTTGPGDAERQRLECRHWFERAGIKAPHPI